MTAHESGSELGGLRWAAVVVDGDGTVLSANAAFKAHVDGSVDPGGDFAALGERVSGDLQRTLGELDPLPAAVADTPTLESVLTGDEATDAVVSRVDGDTERYLCVLAGVDAPTMSPVEESLLSKAPFSVMQVGTDGSISTVNPALEELVGWTEADLLGEPAPFVSDRSLSTWQQLLGQATHGEEPAPRELSLRSASGVARRVRVHAFPRPAATPSERVLVVFEDVTTDRERECELELLRRVLRHNLRNRVNVVQGYAERFAEEIEGDVPESELEDLLAATEGIARASDKASDLRRVFEADRELYPVDVARTVRSVLEGIRAEYPYADVECTVPSAATANVLPVIDLAVRNLVRNAIEHNDRATPTVNIAIRTMSEMGEQAVEITIEDDGPTIPKMELETLKRGEEDSLNHSSGLGLWIAQWVVARSNGKLSYTENEPRGNTIRIQLPLTPGSDDGPLGDGAP